MYNQIGMFPGVSRDVISVITSFSTTSIGFLNHPKSFTKSTFFEGMLIFSWKKLIFLQSMEFFTSQYGTYECVREVLNTLGRYLKFLGADFWYHSSFGKFLFFRPPCSETLVGSAKNWFGGRKNWIFSKRSMMSKIWP